MNSIYDLRDGGRQTKHSQAHDWVIAGIVVTSRLPATAERINPAKRNEFRTCLSSLEYSEPCNLFADNSRCGKFRDLQKTGPPLEGHLRRSSVARVHRSSDPKNIWMRRWQSDTGPVVRNPVSSCSNLNRIAGKHKPHSELLPNVSSSYESKFPSACSFDDTCSAIVRMN
jgi:hypothetical protein